MSHYIDNNMKDISRTRYDNRIRSNHLIASIKIHQHLLASSLTFKKPKRRKRKQNKVNQIIIHFDTRQNHKRPLKSIRQYLQIATSLFNILMKLKTTQYITTMKYPL